jgi:hypothetical protein
MERTFAEQTQRAGLALAAAVALSVLGTGTALGQTFVNSDVSINSVGFLECAFKETGLAPGAQVDYTCAATDVGWVTQCFIKNKPVANLPTRLHVAHNADGLTSNRTLVATNRGTITNAFLTAYPTVEEVPGEVPLCPHVEGVTITEEVTAIRWCNASLADETNDIVGAEAAELFLQLKRGGSADVPSCNTLATLPTDI